MYSNFEIKSNYYHSIFSSVPFVSHKFIANHFLPLELMCNCARNDFVYSDSCHSKGFERLITNPL